MQVKDEVKAAAEAVAVDRRRPGRREVSPALIPLLRAQGGTDGRGAIDWELVGGALLTAAFVTVGMGLRFAV